jgi:hypothetical protein
MTTHAAPAGVLRLTGRGDLDDQRWLAQQVATLGDGIEAARAIWANWTDLRNVGRLHPGMTAGDFIASQLGGLRLDLPRLIAALPDMSNRQIAAIAGVRDTTVMRARPAANAAPDEPDAEPARVIGADGKSYPGRVVGSTTAEVIEPTEEADGTVTIRELLAEAIGAISAVRTVHGPQAAAAAIPAKDRPRMWRELRKAGSFLAQIALLIEGERDK